MIWVSTILAGIFVSLLALRLLQPGFYSGSASHSTPLPRIWRLAWPWIDAGSRLFAKTLSWKSRRRMQSLLVQAALTDALGPGHIVAAQYLAGGLVLAGLLLLAGVANAANSDGVRFVALFMAVAAWMLPRRWLAKRAAGRLRRLNRELPFVLDMTMLCVQAGLNLSSALQQATQYSPVGPLREELMHALAEMRAGATRMHALEALATRTGSTAVKALVSALAQAELLGTSLGPILQAQAAQYRAERFQRADRLAMEAPVKMLFPLIACIFPCTFIVIGFPIAMSLMEANL